jgi:hypothetical protein
MNALEQRRQGPHFLKIDSLRAKFSDNFIEFVDFSLNCRLLEEVEGSQKRA